MTTSTKKKCLICGKKFETKIEKRKFCSRLCFHKWQKGKCTSPNSQFKTGHNVPLPWRIKFSEANKGRIAWNKGRSHLKEDKNPAWKGENASYSAIHYWIKRQKGVPHKCSFCGKTGNNNNNNRQIQWANIDGKYRRNLDDYIPLCASCHKIFDLQRAKHK